MVASSQPLLSVQDYLPLEAESPIKHEYVDGKACVMVGASDSHVTVTVNLAALLRSHGRGIVESILPL